MRNVLCLVCFVGSMGKNSIAREGGEIGPLGKVVELGKIQHGDEDSFFLFYEKNSHVFGKHNMISIVMVYLLQYCVRHYNKL